jgi:hypothetical protein
MDIFEAHLHRLAQVGLCLEFLVEVVGGRERAVVGRGHVVEVVVVVMWNA